MLTAITESGKTFSYLLFLVARLGLLRERPRATTAGVSLRRDLIKAPPKNRRSKPALARLRLVPQFCTHICFGTANAYFRV